MKGFLRVLIYFLGLFLIALGINLSLLSGLGVSPVAAFTSSLSRAAGVRLGAVTALCYSAFVLLEMVILRKQFRPKQLLQIPFCFVFGAFVDWIGSVFADMTVDVYLLRLLILLLGIAALAAGAVIYVAMDIVPNPPEGLILAICKKSGASFGKIKIATDCAYVIAGILISLLFCHDIGEVREGTVLSALLTGKLISFFTGKWQDPLRKIYQKKGKSQKIT